MPTYCINEEEQWSQIEQTIEINATSAALHDQVTKQHAKDVASLWSLFSKMTVAL